MWKREKGFVKMKREGCGDGYQNIEFLFKLLISITSMEQFFRVKSKKSL